MGFWDLINQTNNNSATQESPFKNPYSVYKHYFGAYTTDGKPYSYGSFRSDVREARNHGLNITSQQAHAMRLLAKHEQDWFNSDGSLKEGLSSGDAKRAKTYKAIVSQFYDRIKPRAKKKENKTQNQDLWAANNFKKNGYSIEAAKNYSNILNYDKLVDLWNGDAQVRAGGIYGDKAKEAEIAYYNSLSAPEKRAYLRQREEWIKNGIISGNKLANLTAVTENDMQDYMIKNLDSWHTIFYGNDGYADEYLQAHPTLDPETKAKYEKWGLTIPVATAATWTPSGSDNYLRTSGFEKSKVKKAKKVVKKTQNSNNHASGKNLDLSAFN